MLRKTLISILFPACIVLQVATRPPSAFAADSFGSVDGVSRDSVTGMVIPEAQVVAHNVNSNSTRSAVSASDGSFAIDNLEPGKYTVVATKDGFRSFAANIEVAALATARVDPALAVVDGASPSASLPAAAAPGPLTMTQELESMKRRIEQLEEALKATQDPKPETVTGGVIAPLAAASRPPEAREVAANAIPQTTAPPNGVLASPENPTPATDNFTPFADYDWTWLNGNRATKTWRSTRSFSRLRFGPILLIVTISISLPTIPWAGRANSSGQMRFSWNNWASAKRGDVALGMQSR